MKGTNDCHEELMWCGRMNCLGKEDFKTMMDKKRSGKEDDRSENNLEKYGTSAKFKFPLAAMVIPEDMVTLTYQSLID